MADYVRDPNRVDTGMRQCGIVVVIGREYAIDYSTGKFSAENVINTVKAIYYSGLIPEATARIEDVMPEAMQELRKLRAVVYEKSLNDPSVKPLLLGEGSIINPREMDDAIELGFDFVVSPDAGVGGYNVSMIRNSEVAKKAGVFYGPGVNNSTQLNYFLERDDGLEPDAIKIFDTSVLGPSGVKSILAPSRRKRHQGKLINLTGGVNSETGPKYQEMVIGNGFFPVLGMSSPLKHMTKMKDKMGDYDVLMEVLDDFKESFTHHEDGKWLMRRDESPDAWAARVYGE